MRLFKPRPAEGRKPGARKASVALALAMVLGFTAWAGAQSLAESAKKEKERREAAKKSGAIIVTNADLLMVKKRPSVTNPGTAAPSDKPGQAGAVIVGNENLAQPDVAGLDVKPVISTGQGAPARTAEIAASALEGNPKDMFDKKRADLESRWNAARERLGLLEVKLLALRQQFGNPINADAKDKVGKDLDALAPIIAAAQIEEKTAKDELDKFLGTQATPRK